MNFITYLNVRYVYNVKFIERLQILEFKTEWGCYGTHAKCKMSPPPQKKNWNVPGATIMIS